MVDGLMKRLLRFALSQAKVQHIYAFDTHDTLLHYATLDTRPSEPPALSPFVRNLITRANQANELIMSNNTFIDPSKPPNTNIAIQDLRIYTVIPVPNHGCLFLENPVSQGVVARDVINKLFSVCQHVGSRADGAGITDIQIQELFANA